VYHQLTGVDVSQEMVDFANKTYADENVNFHCLDIATVSISPFLTCTREKVLIITKMV
jgi:hypothetical protein